MKKILLFFACVISLCLVSCSAAKTEKKTDEMVKEAPYTYLVKILNTYLDTIPEIYSEYVDVIVNDTIRHKEIKRIKTRYSLSVEYKYCILGDIVGTDTVWTRVLTAIQKNDFVAYRSGEHGKNAAYDFISEEGDEIDNVFHITESIGALHMEEDGFFYKDPPRCYRFIFNDEIDSVCAISDEIAKEEWEHAKMVVNEHNSKK